MIVPLLKMVGILQISVIYHVAPCRAELGVTADDLIDRIQKVLLTDSLPPSSNGEHSRLGADTAKIRAGRVWAQTRQKFKPDASFTIHAA